MRKRPCLLFACVFLTGIVFQRYRWNGLWLLPIAFLLIELFYGIRNIKHLKRAAGRSVILLSAFFLGMHHMKSQEEFRDTYMSRLRNDSNAVVYGELINITETDYGYRLILNDCYVNLEEANIPCNKVMVYASSDQFQIGQIYQFNGQLHFFEEARNEGNFYSALFYQSQKIDFFLYEESSVLLDANENPFRDGILSLKYHMEQVYKNSMKEDAAGFYMGMMLGDKTLLSQETKDLFAIGGISHILAISGLHMSMIGRNFYNQLRKRRFSFLVSGILSSILVLAYCYMVGSSTSAIRAVGMLLLFFLSQYIGRSYDMLNGLGAVVIYLLWENPFLIEYSGFWFSVAALMGVGFVGKHIWMSLGITLASLPIVASCYYEIPVYSSLVNAIALPMLTPIFILALFGALIGCLIPFLGEILLIPCGWLFYFYEFICEFVKGLPFGTVITGKPEMERLLIYYIVLVLGCIIFEKQKQTQEANSENGCINPKRIVTSMLLAIICFSIILWPKKVKSEIVFLDVGQGDGIYIASEDGTTSFIDGGSSDVRQVGTYRILPFLKAHGVKKINYWFVSHGDMDHISGLLEVMESGYEIDYLVISDKMPEDENKEQLLSKAEVRGVEVIFMSAEDSIVSKQLEIRCLYPWLEDGDKNELSMVLQVEYFDKTEQSIFKGLFSGDISSSVENQLLQENLLEDVDLYKAAHHGSKYSNSKNFLKAIKPEYCFISCGIDNSYGHPHQEAMERLRNTGCEIYSTAESGQLTIGICEKDAISCTNFISLVK